MSDLFSCDLQTLDYSRLLSFITPASALKSTFMCDPSQNGFFLDAPQRQSAMALPGMATVLPSLSVIVPLVWITAEAFSFKMISILMMSF